MLLLLEKKGVQIISSWNCTEKHTPVIKAYNVKKKILKTGRNILKNTKLWIS